MRRLFFMFVVVGTLAGCSSGSGNVSGSANNVSGSTKFCAAFTHVTAAKDALDPVAIGAAFVSAAADMRTYAPTAMKAATGTYADLLDNVGKPAQSGTLDRPGLQQALAKGMTDQTQDISTVAIWVSKNCPS
jgi:hypothetical protein